MASRLALYATLAVVILGALSGCAKKDDPTETSTAPSSTVSAGGNETSGPALGRIQGGLKNEEQAPVAGAQVLIRELNVQAKSDSNGSFAFEDVPVGKYALIAAVIGYEDQGKSVDVLAGETATVEFTLVRITIVESYNETYVYTGRMTCGAVAVPWCGATQDADAPSPTNDAYAFNWTYVEGTFPAHEVLELVWTPTSPTTGQTLALLYFTSTDPVESYTIFSSEGASPVRGEATQKTLEAAHEAWPDSDFIAGVYPAIDGVVIDQGFTLYRTVFYGEAPPEGWTYLSQLDG